LFSLLKIDYVHQRVPRKGAGAWRSTRGKVWCSAVEKEDGRGMDVPIGGNSEQVVIIRGLKEAKSELHEDIQGRLECEDWV